MLGTPDFIMGLIEFQPWTSLGLIIESVIVSGWWLHLNCTSCWWNLYLKYFYVNLAGTPESTGKSSMIAPFVMFLVLF